MRVLYAIQGTGNGHLSRARDIIPQLLNRKIKLDLLISGTASDVYLPYTVHYQCKGLSFTVGKRGGIDLWKTYWNADTLQLNKEVASLPVDQYDLIINDFEPVSAWACRLNRRPCISLSHQAAVLSPNAPKPKLTDPIGKAILRHYAPTTRQYGFHFKTYQQNIFTPVIRQDVRLAPRDSRPHYTVYLPAYQDEHIIHHLSKIKGVTWVVFSRYAAFSYSMNGIKVHPITNKRFVDSMASGSGVLCGSGFETPAEALFLRKKLMVIPVKGQYEQQCNAAALQDMGVPVIKSLKHKHLDTIRHWVDSEQEIDVEYPDNTSKIVEQLLDEAC